jgi:hypothetical protein
MAYKVVATPFGGRTDTSYPHEHEALRPLRIGAAAADREPDQPRKTSRMRSNRPLPSLSAG